jgi:hypothetical protein
LNPPAPSIPATIAATGFAAAGFVSAPLDIQDVGYVAQYSANLTGSLTNGTSNVNTYNAPTFVNTNFVNNASISLPLYIQAAASSYGTAGAMNNVGQIARTQAYYFNNGFVIGNLAPPVLSGTLPGDSIPVSAASGGFAAFAITAPGAPVTMCAGNGGACTSGQVTSVNLTARADGPTAVFPNKFARVDFYAQVAGTTRWVKIATASSPSLNDNGNATNGRQWSWTASVSSATLYPLVAASAITPVAYPNVPIMALGVSSAGNYAMIVAANNTQITINP